jgi:hypothetical protein
MRAVLEARNVVVATGTGSGKTEAFLYPVLAELYREHRSGTLGAGVRALILYPMNALANDQRERLRELCRSLQQQDPTFLPVFGEFTGHTPENRGDSQRDGRARERNRAPGELVFREEMRASPPHILLTNYSMLEYLLLRPDDSPLFDGQHGQTWRFLVLDEAHQYRGARGVEMAMLLRRLKRRLRESGLRRSLVCIATSATLADGDAGRPAVARFAAELFDEPFDTDGVILAQTRATPEPSSEEPLTAGELSDAVRAVTFNDPSRLDEVAVRRGVPTAGGWRATAARLLERDNRVARLRNRLASGAASIDSLAAELFQDVVVAEREEALINLVQLLMAAQRPEDGTPLMRARLHVFLRALEGAFVRFHPTREVLLTRSPPHEREGVGAAFEIALCRECGQHYFLAQRDLQPGQVIEPVRDPDDDRFGVTYLRPVNATSEPEKDAGPRWQLCLRCGSVADGEPTCGHGMAIEVEVGRSPDDEDRADELRRCGACGYAAAGRDPVRELVHGADGPGAVVATALVRYQPPGRRKVLAFADGRQSAAFFAWYLDDSFRDIQSRNLILTAARSLDAGRRREISLSSLKDEVYRILADRGLFAESDDEIKRHKETWKRLFRELLTDERRLGLEGVGLVAWTPALAPDYQVPEDLLRPPWGFDRVVARQLVQALLDTLRLDRAVALGDLEPGVRLAFDDLSIQGGGQRARLGRPRAQGGIVDWAGARGRRRSFLRRILTSRGIAEAEAADHANRALCTVWESLIGDSRKRHEPLLMPDRDAHVLNWRWYRLRALTESDALYCCSVCRRLHAENIAGLCSAHDCPGRLQRVSPDDAIVATNHYRLLYAAADLPPRMRVEEHTAQLQYNTAAAFQREFREGKIDVLSSSTTFELGVDLGDLDTVFLRNVPPEPFNYVQRAGRAGRRDSPGLVVTFCRRDPHNLSVFHDPGRMISGRTGPPPLAVRNVRIIARHMTAVALSAFFRGQRERFGSVSKFFRDLSKPDAVDVVRDFTERHRVILEATLRAVVPEGLHAETGLASGAWLDAIAGPNSRLAHAQHELASEYRLVRQFEKEASEQRRYEDARWAQSRATTIESEDLLGYLARKVIIPKYGFPVDVVELDTQPGTARGNDVALQRDLSLAIGEYAPGCEVVANKRQWRTHALKRVPEKEWEEGAFSRCAVHGSFCCWPKTSAAPSLMPCGCPVQPRAFVVPMFGFTSSREGPSSPRRQRVRDYATRPFFAGHVGEPPQRRFVPEAAPVLSVTPAAPGRMVVLCEGPKRNGFWICRDCGYGSRAPERPHANLFGRKCHGRQDALCLAHEFRTDVVLISLLATPEVRREHRDALVQSVAQALSTAAAEVLEVQPDDVSAVVEGGESTLQPVVVLFDNVPGGAGLAARLGEVDLLRRCFMVGRDLVDGHCNCDPETSCYGCLRTYRNRYQHTMLYRGLALAFFDFVLGRWRSLPDDRGA